MFGVGSGVWGCGGVGCVTHSWFILHGGEVVAATWATSRVLRGSHMGEPARAHLDIVATVCVLYVKGYESLLRQVLQGGAHRFASERRGPRGLEPV